MFQGQLHLFLDNSCELPLYYDGDIISIAYSGKTLPVRLSQKFVYN